MFTENFTIKYKYRDMFSSGEYITLDNDENRVDENVPTSFYRLKLWMEDNSITKLTFLGKNYFDGIICRVSYDDICCIEKTYELKYINEESYEFNYIGGADF